MRFLAYIFLVLFVKTSFAQTQGFEATTRKDEIFTVVEEMPQFPGGMGELMKFVQANIVYPKMCKDLNIGGKAFLKFTVTKEGKIENVHSLKGTGFPAMDDEAVRVVGLMPDWKPGRQNGKVVDVYFNLPINFTLPTPYYIFNIANTSQNYIETKELIGVGGNEKDILRLLLKDSGKNTNLDVMYNIAVAYYLLKNNKKSCEYFKDILKISDEKITVINNSKEFLQKYCSN